MSGELRPAGEMAAATFSSPIAQDSRPRHTTTLTITPSGGYILTETRSSRTAIATQRLESQGKASSSTMLDLRGGNTSSLRSSLIRPILIPANSLQERTGRLAQGVRGPCQASHESRPHDGSGDDCGPPNHDQERGKHDGFVVHQQHPRTHHPIAQSRSDHPWSPHCRNGGLLHQHHEEGEERHVTEQKLAGMRHNYAVSTWVRSIWDIARLCPWE